jgi:DNA-binding transcriptional regulator YdaS (Cro superfamily)
MEIHEIIAAAGGPVRLAQCIGIKHSSVLGWRRVPAERVAAVAEATGLARHLIRPDLYEQSSAA